MLSRKKTNYRGKRRTILLGGLEPQYHPGALLDEMSGLVADANLLGRIDARVDVEKLIQKIRSPRLQKTMKLLFIDGLNEKEAGEEMGLSQTTVNTLKYRLIRRLRVILKDEI